ncbi:hypothetical protein P691DRAFT_782304 [Macrolepiota fuliginosa MF-IS2]|uniref:Uncharacterized protein n=1 Tax=Macrolepiota fuliginosa MF-IS2 TaxID=1400762 RepID=A0A9P5WZ08_9AGAR|nr:hypothetical protein P691DRAFT_782304 [Macrolepiota fuliginosa MF-IS2]
MSSQKTSKCQLMLMLDRDLRRGEGLKINVVFGKSFCDDREAPVKHKPISSRVHRCLAKASATTEHFHSEATVKHDTIAANTSLLSSEKTVLHPDFARLGAYSDGRIYSTTGNRDYECNGDHILSAHRHRYTGSWRWE